MSAEAENRFSFSTGKGWFPVKGPNVIRLIHHPVHHLLVDAHMVMTGIRHLALRFARSLSAAHHVYHHILMGSCFKNLFYQIRGRVSEWRDALVHRVVNQGAAFAYIVADIGGTSLNSSSSLIQRPVDNMTRFPIRAARFTASSVRCDIGLLAVQYGAVHIKTN